MIRTYKFETLGGKKVESKIFPLGREPSIQRGDTISVRYSDYDFCLMFEAAEDEVVETMPDDDAVKYGDTVTPETDTTTKHETKGIFYILGDGGQQLLGTGIWYAHENRTVFFDVENQDTNVYTSGELPAEVLFNSTLDYKTYQYIRRSRHVDHIVHSRKIDTLADSDAAV